MCYPMLSHVIPTMIEPQATKLPKTELLCVNLAEGDSSGGITRVTWRTEPVQTEPT